MTTLDEITTRLSAAGPDVAAEAERITEGLEAELARMWPKSPPAARTGYAAAKIRFALAMVKGNQPSDGGGYVN